MFTNVLTAVLTTAFMVNPVAQTPSVSPIAFTEVLPVAEVISYTVTSGDTLESIAQDRYGDSSYWKTLWNDNSWITDPNSLEVGTRLTIRATRPATPDEEVLALQKEAVFQEQSVALAQAAPVIPTPTLMPTIEAPTAAVPSPTAAETQQVNTTAPVTAFDDVYRQAGEKYGVPWQVLYGLHITETGGRDGMIMNGSGSGARGPMQFMPGTWRAYGVDGDGDGVANIDNAVDAIHGAANYLAKHGSLESGLRSYGGNTSRTLVLAREKGFNQ